jgi:hypothetical protein
VGAPGTTSGFFEKRELLYAAQADAPALAARGRALLEAGLSDSALEMFVKGGDAEGLALVVEAARRAGDAFTFEAALKALGKTAAPAEWVALGETALGAGLLWFAYRAFEKADNQDGLERTRRQMHEAGITPS